MTLSLLCIDVMHTMLCSPVNSSFARTYIMIYRSSSLQSAKNELFFHDNDHLASCAYQKNCYVYLGDKACVQVITQVAHPCESNAICNCCVPYAVNGSSSLGN
jgi:hypothetical protein